MPSTQTSNHAPSPASAAIPSAAMPPAAMPGVAPSPYDGPEVGLRPVQDSGHTNLLPPRNTRVNLPVSAQALGQPTHFNSGRSTKDTPTKEVGTVALIKDAFSEAFAVVEAHVELAAVELREDAQAAARIAAASVAGGACLVLTLGLFSAAAVFALDLVFATWLACLIVGTVHLVAALTAFLIARTKLQRRNFTPEKTVQSLKENKKWIAEKLS